MVTLAQAAHSLLAASGTKPLDLGCLQPVREAPAVGDAAAAVDDVGEVLETVRGHRVRLPAHRPHLTTSGIPST